jgi:hypothetical protein
VTDSEPESGGQLNAEFIAGRVSEAADSVAAHVVLGAGDQHILDAVGGHLPDSVGPVTTIAGSREPDGLDDHLSAAIGAALDEITATAASAVGDLVASRTGEPDPGAVRGLEAVADQLAEQQVAVLLVAADTALEDDLVWAAIRQDAIVVQLPERTGPLAGEAAAALLRRGSAS